MLQIHRLSESDVFFIYSGRGETSADNLMEKVVVVIVFKCENIVL